LGGGKKKKVLKLMNMPRRGGEKKKVPTVSKGGKKRKTTLFELYWRKERGTLPGEKEEGSPHGPFRDRRKGREKKDFLGESSKKRQVYEKEKGKNGHFTG